MDDDKTRNNDTNQDDGLAEDQHSDYQPAAP